VSSQYPPGGRTPSWPPPNLGQTPPSLGQTTPGGLSQTPPNETTPRQNGPDRRKSRRRWPRPVRWFLAVVLTLFALLCVVGGIKVTGQANTASASNEAQANAAAQTQTADDRWATTPVTKVFPATITAAVSGIVWNRATIDSSTSCDAALTADWQPDSNRPCTAVLRATYTDQARTIAATVGVIVNPSSTDPAGASMYDTWLSPIQQAQSQSEGLGATQTTVDFPIHALAAPGTAAASFGDSDLLAMTSGTLLSGAPSDWLALVVETGSLDGHRVAGDLPAPWASQGGGNHRDRDSWYIPAQDLTTAFGTYYQKLFGG
jgi:hypothetical protein